MRTHRARRGLLMASVVLALVGAACGKNATASEGDGGTTGGGTTGNSGGMTATTVMEGPGNSYTFSPSTVKVNEGQTIRLENVSDDAHTFTVIGQSIDVETLPGKTSRVAIDLPPGTYRFVCRFHRSMGMKGLLLVRSAIE
jgi:plastocyanin